MFLNYFEKLVLTYLKNVCLSSFRRPNSVKLPFLCSCSKHFMNQAFSSFFFAFLFLQEDTAHKQLLHSPHNGPYLRPSTAVAAHHKTDDPLNCRTSSSDISGYHADFHSGHITDWKWQDRGRVAAGSQQENSMGTACNV
jgi:hypothetical protein